MSSEIINMRTDAERKERLRIAAELSAVSLSRFVLDAATARADEVLAQQRTTALPEAFFDGFFAALEADSTGQDATVQIEAGDEALAALASRPRPYRRR